jgi:hypothetical protein
MSRIITCLKCHSRLRVADCVTEPTLLCPRCLARVDNPVAGVRLSLPSIDTDVRRDLGAGSIALGVLIGLCLLGVALSFVFSKRTVESALGFLLFMMLCFTALDVLVSIACVRALWRWGMSGIRTPSVGRILGLTVLSIGTVGAVVVFFFVTCFALASVR